MPQIFVKDPDAVLDYSVDWTSWIAEGDSISTHSVAVDGGDVTVQGTPTLDGARLTAVIAGGTAGTDARVRFRVSTVQGRTDDQSIELRIRST